MEMMKSERYTSVTTQECNENCNEQGSGRLKEQSQAHATANVSNTRPRARSHDSVFGASLDTCKCDDVPAGRYTSTKPSADSLTPALGPFERNTVIAVEQELTDTDESNNSCAVGQNGDAKSC